MSARRLNPSSEMTFIEEARRLFAEIARRRSLIVEWDEYAPIEVAGRLRKQPGLDWDLRLNLQNNDELSVQHEVFSAEWFPASDARRVAEFTDVVDGLISGEVRIKCFSTHSGARPFRVDLERLSSNEWRRVFIYRLGFPVGLAESIQVLRNGYPAEPY